MAAPRARELVRRARRRRGTRSGGSRRPPPAASFSFHVRYDEWFFASSCRSARRTPISRSRSGSSSTRVTPCATRTPLFAMPSKRTAARVFIVRTDASNPASPRTKRSCRYANVVTCPGTTSWLTSCWNSGTEIWSDGVQLVRRLVLGRAVRLARVAEVVHRAGEPRVLDREELDVRPRDASELLRQVRKEVPRRERVVVRDEGVAERRDRLARDETLLPPARRPRARSESPPFDGCPAGLQELGDAPALLLRVRGLGRRAA